MLLLIGCLLRSCDTNLPIFRNLKLKTFLKIPKKFKIFSNNTFQAIRSAQKEDDTHWLIYWTVFAAFSLIDFIAEFIFSYFPVYWVFKVSSPVISHCLDCQSVLGDEFVPNTILFLLKTHRNTRSHKSQAWGIVLSVRNTHGVIVDKLGSFLLILCCKDT